MRLATDSAGIGFWEYDLVTNRQRWDDRLLEIYGITRRQFRGTGKFWLSRLHPDDRDIQKQLTEQSRFVKKVFRQEFRVIRPDGHVRHVWSASVVERDPAGQPLRLIGVNYDITDNKNARLQATAMTAINEVIHATSDRDEIMNTVLVESRSALGYDAAACFLRNQAGGLELSHGLKLPGDKIGQEAAVPPCMSQSKHPCGLEDITDAQRVNYGISVSWNARSAFIIPLVVRGESAGLIYFIFNQSVFRFDDCHLDYGMKLSTSVSLALENARLFADLQTELKDRIMYEDSLQRANQRMNLVAEIAGALLRSRRPDEVVDRMCRKALPVLGCDVFYNYLLDPETRRLRLNVCEGLSARERARIEWIDLGQHACGHVALSGTSLIAERLNASADVRIRYVASLGVLAYACFPLMDSQGEVVGTLSFGTRMHETFDRDNLELMKTIAEHVASGLVRMRNENRLRESEARYHDLFRNMNDGFALLEVVFDRQLEPASLIFKDVNAAFEQQLGIPRPRIIDRELVDVLPDPENKLPDSLIWLARSSEPVQGSYTHVASNRRFDWYAYRPADGKIALILRDVTVLLEAKAREQNALAIAAAAQTAREVLDSMGDAVLLLDMHGRISSVNRAYELLTGRKGAELAGQRSENVLRDLLDEAQHAPILSELQARIQGKEARLAPFRIRQLDGSSFPVMPAVAFIRGKDLQPTSIVLTLRDISELMQAEEEVRRVSAYNRRLIESSLDPLFMIGPDGGIEDVNLAAEKITGVSRARLIGSPLARYFIDRKKAEASWQKTFRDGSVRNQYMDIRHRSGELAAVLCNGSVYYDANGHMVGAIVAARDITERRRLEAEREEYHKRLKQLAGQLSSTEERARHRIASQIHDTVIQTLSLSNIKLGAIKSQLAGASLEVAAQDVAHVRTLLGEAINESRALMAELTPPLLHELGLVPALQDLAERLEKLHGNSIIVKEDERAKSLDKGVERTLFRSARELIMNALKHGGPCTIAVEVMRKNEHLEICVEDDGYGFTLPADQHFAYGSQGGFGLFTIRERLEELGGEISIQSEPGKGTRATLLMPIDAKTGSTNP